MAITKDEYEAMLLQEIFVEDIRLQQADADAKKLRRFSGIAVVNSEADNNASWIRAGQVYERLALKLTSL
jgi:hypothetical protein